jgi:hypothetical protein
MNMKLGVEYLRQYSVRLQTVWPRFDPRQRTFFYSLCVQTSHEAHPASYPFPRVKRGQGDAENSSLSSVEVKNE